MLIAINKSHPDKPSIEILSSREYISSFVNHEIEKPAFIDYTRKGYDFCAALTKPYRIRANFLSSQVMAVDFDTGDRRSSFDALMENNFIREYGSFLYTTPSHSPDAPRSRAVFVLSTPIYNANSFEIMLNALLHKMENNDPSCKDAARIFFGSLGCDILDIGKTLPAKWFFYQVAIPYAKSLAQKQKVTSGDIVYNGSGTYALQQIVKKGINQLVATSNGERNTTLNKLAFMWGGLVAAGYSFSQKEAIELLIETAQSIPDALPKQEIERTVYKSVTRGMNHPIYLNDPHSDFLDTIK